ncbi:MAG: DUF1992 domain-containing protein [Pseudomonadota bacterium]|nr:DUF1992 domain-containing protein [Pseudomonadota bacterium]
MDPLDRIAEAHIQRALERGELQNLPGEGKPLHLDDDTLIPEELRAAYRLLKNAGFLPPELEVRRQIADAGQLVRQAAGPEQRSRAWARLEMLRLRLQASRRQGADLRLEEHYYQKLLNRLDHD